MKKFQTIRGTHDFLPEDTIYMQHIENTFKNIVNNYGYYEIHFPILENTMLFKKAIGKNNDLIQKEMYTFVDKKKNNITLRPEGTASCIRVAVQHGLLREKEKKFWYKGPMFRYERPQKGRYRQFHQLGAEIFGHMHPNNDIELIALTSRWWKILGIQKNISLEINFLGNSEEYRKYEKKLTEFFVKNKQHLDNSCQKYIQTNPMRILDTKNKNIQKLIHNAPIILNFLNKKSKNYFSNICKILNTMHITHKINPYLVRGLDYYNSIIFEWVTYNLGKKLTICGGGRYDHLIKRLGGKETPAIGFAVGLERLMLLIKQKNPNCITKKHTDIYIITTNNENIKYEALLLSENIRNIFPYLQIIVNYEKKSIRKQFQNANKYNTKIVLLLGEKEKQEEKIIFKNLIKKTQKKINRNDIIKNLKEFFISKKN
ncbi:MAG: histidine--tRNA ligase [Candidatus Westeberhardia cardiocondylae]|nr:histidine--tRNA ligase [Candidatus Westeberhardia cardiocondylae]